MKTAYVLVFFALVLCTVGCSSGDCDLEAGRWSVANSGGLCQANIFGDVDYAAYCTTNADGTYECACGAVAQNPLEFTSKDFCDLVGEERVCAAVDQCGWVL